MKWYLTLTRKQKAAIRECFELACGMSLNHALKFFKFSDCMDLLYNKLTMEGIIQEK